MTEAREMTFGEKAVGTSFNPGGMPAVTEAKAAFAKCIDLMNDLRTTTDNPEIKRMASVAITEAQTAQMWAVKAITWTQMWAVKAITWSNCLGGAVEANKIRNLDGCGMSERVSAKGLIRQRVRQLTQQARGLEALAASLPEEMNPQAEAALMDMFR